MKTGVIVQARMSSQRLPDKVLTMVNGKPLLQYLLERLTHCSSIDQIVVATSEDKSDKGLMDALIGMINDDDAEFVKKTYVKETGKVNSFNNQKDADNISVVDRKKSDIRDKTDTKATQRRTARAGSDS